MAIPDPLMMLHLRSVPVATGLHAEATDAELDDIRHLGYLACKGNGRGQS